MKPWFVELGLERSISSARKLGATVLLLWLAREARTLMAAAPLSYLSWLNLALGHRPRSNQWAPYLVGYC